MTEAVAPAVAEGVAVAALRAGLAARSDTAHVAQKVPATRPPRMCRVSLIDTTTVTPIHHRSVLLVECWAATEAEALTLARRAFGVLVALEDAANVAEVEVDGLVYYPDPDAGPRYQFTAALTLEGELI